MDTHRPLPLHVSLFRVHSEVSSRPPRPMFLAASSTFITTNTKLSNTKAEEAKFTIDKSYTSLKSLVLSCDAEAGAVSGAIFDAAMHCAGFDAVCGAALLTVWLVGCARSDAMLAAVRGSFISLFSRVRLLPESGVGLKKWRA
ncbi:hypothetical protein PIB30_052251 [Stylosanthes scabra]|uniref:Uncharacterized protein n=1 Tax=Stylosanthes scabra TaxID=79078 RepID=A0ABU6UHK8_9FABA|nr:hypothetical protein [Stylosanthes scabra]